MRTNLLLMTGAASLLLVACGQPDTEATTDAVAADTAQLVPASADTASMADVAGVAEDADAGPPTETEPPQPSASFAGEYEGPFGEGGTGYVTLTGGGPTYRAEVVVTTPDGCSGQVEGDARANGETLILRAPHDDGVCTITMRRSGQSLAVSQDNCAYWAGMNCGFSGTVRRTQ